MIRSSASRQGSPPPEETTSSIGRRSTQTAGQPKPRVSCKERINVSRCLIATG